MERGYHKLEIVFLREVVNEDVVDVMQVILGKFW